MFPFPTPVAPDVVAVSSGVLYSALRLDGETLLRLWKAMDKYKEMLRSGHGDNVSKGKGVMERKGG